MPKKPAWKKASKAAILQDEQRRAFTIEGRRLRDPHDHPDDPLFDPDDDNHEDVESGTLLRKHGMRIVRLEPPTTR